MIYKDFQDLKISQLAMGCMRLPLAGKDQSQIDELAKCYAWQWTVA